MRVRAELEIALEEKCVEYAFEQGFAALKADAIKKGWPDQIFFGPRRKFMMVEFKLPGEIPSPKQYAVHRLLERLGFRVHVVTTFGGFVSLLTSCASIR